MIQYHENYYVASDSLTSGAYFTSKVDVVAYNGLIVTSVVFWQVILLTHARTGMKVKSSSHDEVIKWKYILRYWHFVQEFTSYR